MYLVLHRELRPHSLEQWHRITRCTSDNVCGGQYTYVYAYALADVACKHAEMHAAEENDFNAHAGFMHAVRAYISLCCSTFYLQLLAQIRTQQEEDATHVPYTTFESVVVPWIVQNEKALKRADFHSLMKAFKAFDLDNKGWVDSQMLKTTLTTKVCPRLTGGMCGVFEHRI
jgi:hypothetical protein